MLKDQLNIYHIILMRVIVVHIHYKYTIAHYTQYLVVNIKHRRVQ